MTFCARCRRSLTRVPIIVGGLGYGPTCAAKVGGDLLVPQQRAGAVRHRVPKPDARQMPLETNA